MVAAIFAGSRCVFPPVASGAIVISVLSAGTVFIIFVSVCLPVVSTTYLPLRLWSGASCLICSCSFGLTLRAFANPLSFYALSLILI